MPYLSSNIPKKLFYSALIGEFLRIARATLYLPDFEPKAIDLVKRIVNQGGDCKCAEKYLSKIIRRHPDSFSQFSIGPVDLVQKCKKIYAKITNRITETPVYFTVCPYILFYILLTYTYIYIYS